MTLLIWNRNNKKSMSLQHKLSITGCCHLPRLWRHAWTVGNPWWNWRLQVSTRRSTATNKYQAQMMFLDTTKKSRHHVLSNSLLHACHSLFCVIQCQWWCRPTQKECFAPCFNTNCALYPSSITFDNSLNKYCPRNWKVLNSYVLSCDYKPTY